MIQFKTIARGTNTSENIWRAMTSASVTFFFIVLIFIDGAQMQHGDFVFPGEEWETERDEDLCPNGQRGNCIEIRNCKFITDILKTAPKPFTAETQQLLQSYQCGFEGKFPKVCCPLDTSPTIELNSGTNQSPPDISNHKNLGLINPRICGPIAADRIYGGNTTVPFEFPWMVLIAYQTKNGLGFRCGGTLINERYVLTAAHCIAHLDELTIAGARLGEHNIETDIDCDPETPDDCAPAVQDFTVTEIIPHPEYNPSPSRLENDIGLLRLGGPASFASESVRPICLPVGPTMKDTLQGKNAVVSGWGATETGYSSPALLQIDLPVVENEECQRRYNQTRTNIKIGIRQMCAGGVLGKDSCSGDSGGPLIYTGKVRNDTKQVQYGIVSFGPKNCGMAVQPGVYTRVAFYMDWILDNMKP